MDAPHEAGILPDQVDRRYEHHLVGIFLLWLDQTGLLRSHFCEEHQNQPFSKAALSMNVDDDQTSN